VCPLGEHLKEQPLLQLDLMPVHKVRDRIQLQSAIMQPETHKHKMQLQLVTPLAKIRRAQVGSRLEVQQDKLDRG
jgi:hypothetical protein